MYNDVKKVVLTINNVSKVVTSSKEIKQVINTYNKLRLSNVSIKIIK